MTLFNRAFGAEIAISQLDTGLTAHEASGSLAVDYGLSPARRMQTPRDWPSPLLRFFAPSAASPAPSARRAAPRRNPPSHAA